MIILAQPINSYAMNIAGIEVPDRIELAADIELTLNGAGTRTKLFHDIYVGALYLQQPARTASDVLHTPGPKRIALHFVYHEVSAEKLREGWNDGFYNNLNPQQLEAVDERLQASYEYFQDMRAGDTLYLDYLPDRGTRISVNNQVRGIIRGDDFFHAVLKVWIGDRPAQRALKNAMLGN